MSTDSTPRRDFLAQLAAVTAATTLGACARATAQPPAAAPAPARPATPPAALTYDDSWTAKVQAAKHKAVFDAPDVADGLGLFHVGTYLRGYKAVFNTAEGDVHPVLVLRHLGTALAMDDALWAKYDVGKAVKYKHPATKQWYTFNPFSRPHDDKEKGMEPSLLEGMLKSGVTVLACNQALTGFAGQIAAERKLDRGAVLTEFRAGLVPGVILQPSGIYATIRAQEVGCVFMRST